MRVKVAKKQNNARHCFICGVDNEHGLKARFYELADGTLAATAVARPFHQSYPERSHGGVTTALLDEAIGRAINIAEPETWAVTVELETRFRKPVPYDVPLLVTARIVESNRIFFVGEGCVYLPTGEAAVAARAKYMRMPLSSISGFDVHQDWALFPEEDDPEAFDIPEPEDWERRISKRH